MDSGTFILGLLWMVVGTVWLGWDWSFLGQMLILAVVAAVLNKREFDSWRAGE